ncbi:MAG: hypothetical protein IT440_12265 [Phycisphaeraceae bacterium]|nr:hypothetical protein [Phycisphaeraceae bacterium]
MKTLAFGLLLVCLLCCVCGAQEPQESQELPEPPKDFHWTRFEEIKGAILMPDAWHLKKVSRNPDVIQWIISKESLEEHRMFETGLTYRWMKEVRNKSQGKIPPSQCALAMLDMAENQLKLESKNVSKQGMFDAVRYVYIDHKEGAKDVRVYNLLIANDKTGCLHMVIFEAPVAEWDQAWKLGETMLKRILLSPDA